MTTVEIIYDHTCPNVPATRAQVLRAFVETGKPPKWREWERSDPASPDYVRAYGSPTVLVNGKDVAGAEPSNGAACCRLYAGSSGETGGTPSLADIVSAIQAGGGFKAGGRPQQGGLSNALTTLLGIGVTLLPVGICPACWPAYFGLLSALGLGFLLKTTYLLPVTVVFLLLAVGTLAFRAPLRRGYGPFALGMMASASIVIGKFVFVSNVAMYGGLVLLIVASVWNAWPRRITGACPACAPGGRTSSSQPQGAREVSS